MCCSWPSVLQSTQVSTQGLSIKGADTTVAGSLVFENSDATSSWTVQPKAAGTNYAITDGYDSLVFTQGTNVQAFIKSATTNTETNAVNGEFVSRAVSSPHQGRAVLL